MDGFLIMVGLMFVAFAILDLAGAVRRHGKD